MLRLCLFVLVMLNFSLTAQASDLKEAPALKDMINQGARFSETFNVDEDLQGVIAEHNGNTYPVYKFKKSNYLFYGDLLQQSGKNLTEEHIKLYPLEAGDISLWESLEKTSSVKSNVVGKRTIYSFIDTNCPVCKAQWRLTSPYTKKRLDMRYILVAYIKPESEAEAVRILASDDPYSALEKNENAKSKSLKTSLITAKDNSFVSEIRKNNNLMEELGVAGTPTNFYRGADGNVYRIDGMLTPALIERLLMAD